VKQTVYTETLKYSYPQQRGIFKPNSSYPPHQFQRLSRLKKKKVGKAGRGVILDGAFLRDFFWFGCFLRKEVLLCSKFCLLEQTSFLSHLVGKNRGTMPSKISVIKKTTKQGATPSDF